MNILSLVLILAFSFVYSLSSNSRKNNSKRTIDDDYYLDDDYEINNNSVMREFKSDSLILPNPENLDSKYTIDVLPNVELPDDSLADSDLKDHDFIDNIMYVYYGSHNKNESNYAKEVIIIGSVLSCAAQLLTICCTLLRKHSSNKRDMKNILFHPICCLCGGNLLFMLGVYATRNHLKCLMISLSLHYLNLTTAFWVFLYCHYIYKRILSSNTFKYYSYLAYGAPFAYTLVSYLISPESYEFERFCFISIKKGIVLNYMLPMGVFLVATSLYSIDGIRQISLELSKLIFTSSVESLNTLKSELEVLNDRKEGAGDEITSLKGLRSCLILLCVIQTGYNIIWFLLMMSLETSSKNSILATFYAIYSCILNWYIFWKSKKLLPSPNSANENIEDVNVQSNCDIVSVSLSRRESGDNIPLLDQETGTELKELNQENISTISN